MRSIEQLRRDQRPLISISTASEVTGEPLGNLLSHLADNDISLFLQRPEEAYIYCVTQSPSVAFREGTYQETIISIPTRPIPSGFTKPKRGETHIDANQFGYLVLSNYDYRALLDGEISLSIKFFSEIANIVKGKLDPNLVNARSYYRKHIPAACLTQILKARFGCYLQNKDHPSAFNLTNVAIEPEKLLVSRTDLLNLIEDDEKPNASFPAEIINHLQPWKSDLLLGLNKAAFIIHSNEKSITKNKKTISKTEVQEAIIESTHGTIPSDTTLNRLTTLLRDQRQPVNFKKVVNGSSAQKYPAYFTPRLIYLNEMCEKYYMKCHSSETQKLPTASIVKIDLQQEGVISSDTAVRIASAIIPVLRKTNS